MNTFFKYTTKSKHLISFTFSLALLAFSHAHAFTGTLETAELVQSGYYRLGVAPQLYMGNGGGLDNSAFLDIPMDTSWNSRYEIGFGETQFWAAASAKWVPIPDYEKQPAIGLKAKLIYARENDSNFYNTQLAPIISKKVETAKGLFIPYASLPFTYIYEKSTNNFMLAKLCFGSEWVARSDFQAGAELSIDLYNGTTYYTFAASTISVFFNFQFDERIGFKK